eukprot:TRINITY_DN6379_c0_g1_i1.p1 TRINITY_DN6379_c0_g1~~TRINITY_DN6379_c0_g1_i1.p1  ORF type:complete len:441 (-),score=79.84 TRINITY_DN6379_c0_g1_i1:277-1599(-)
MEQRIEKIKKRLSERRIGLQHDVNPDSDVNSASLLMPNFEKHEQSTQEHRPSKITSKVSRPITMDALFQPQNNTQNTTNNLQKRSEIEKTLHNFETSFVGRMVDDQIYRIESPPFSIEPKLMINYTLEMMHIEQAPKSFGHFVLSKLSCQTLETLFWLIHCDFFQARSETEMSHLRRRIAANYVKILNAVPRSYESFFQNLPYVYAGTICFAFHYLVPGSRHRYTSKFKHLVFVQVCRLLSGVSICESTVRQTRIRLFPKEPSHNIYLGDDATIDLIRSGSSSKPEKLPSHKQMQVTFDGKGMSTLMQDFLQVPSQSFGNQALKMKRTNPVPWLRVGGTNTYTKHHSRTAIRNDIKTEFEEKLHSYSEFNRHHQRETLRKLKNVETRKDDLLSGGLAHIGRFCLDIAESGLSEHPDSSSFENSKRTSPNFIELLGLSDDV